MKCRRSGRGGGREGLHKKVGEEVERIHFERKKSFPLNLLN